VPGLLLSDVPELQHFLFSSLIFFGLTARVTLDLAVHRQYIAENPARAVKHFNELRERAEKQMLTLDRETRIFAWVLFCSFKRRENLYRRIPAPLGRSGFSLMNGENRGLQLTEREGGFGSPG